MEGITIVDKNIISIDTSILYPITTWNDCVKCHEENGHFELIKEKEILSDEDYESIKKCYKKV